MTGLGTAPGEASMLPKQLLVVREIGDASQPYWTACSDDGVELALEPGETLLHVAHCQVSQIAPQRWELPGTTTLVVTDRRTAFLTTSFDTGGGWAGFGVIGLTVATAANAVSKHKAAQRSAGKVAIGQVRHEWLTGLEVRHVKALIGIIDTYLDLKVAAQGQPGVIELLGRQVRDQGFAQWLAGVVAARRLALRDHSPEAERTLLRYRQGEHDVAPAKARQTGVMWSFPDNAEELITAAVERA